MPPIRPNPSLSSPASSGDVIPDPSERFEVMVLGYGDHPNLIRRCLGSIACRLPHPRVAGVTILLNAPSDRTYETVCQCVGALESVPYLVASYAENRRKYPVLREFIRRRTFDADYVMWFDDDSCLRPTADAGWWHEAHAVAEGADFVGRRLYCALGGAQADYIRSRTWYTGVPVSRGLRVAFPVGGWWIGRRSTLIAQDWPPTDLGHNGGDVMLGALIQQQGLTFTPWHEGVAVNADAALADDRCPRRGLSEPPLGWNFSGSEVSTAS